MESHYADMRDIELNTGRKIPYLRFPHLVVLYIIPEWIGEHEITKLNKKKYIFASNPKKQAQKDMNEMCMRKRHLFCTSSHHNVLHEKQQVSSKRGLSLEMSVLARARAQLLNMLHNSTHLSIPHGQYI